MLQELKIKGLKVLQDPKLQSVSLDSLLIADFVKINRKVKKILDIGTGNGIISMILNKKTTADIISVDILEKSCEIAIKNREINKLSYQVVNCDILNYLKDETQVFDVIVSNPPYFVEQNEKQLRSAKEMRIARNEETLSLSKLLSVSKRLLKQMGHLYLVIRVSRLTELINKCYELKLSVKEVLFVYTKKDEEALLCLVDIGKGHKDGLKVLSPLNVYDEKLKKAIYEEI